MRFIYISMSKKHTSVALPKEMQETVKELIEKYPELGYTSFAEFCKDAIREKIMEVISLKELKNIRR